MINRIFANHDSFHEIHLQPGFNVVLAERAKESTRQDSRNGLGKSTLLRILHFCLGSDGKGLCVKDLRDWEFGIDLEIAGERFIARRSISDADRVYLDLPVPGDSKLDTKIDECGALFISVDKWKSFLGEKMFGVSLDNESSEKFTPSFRSLISYFGRVGREAFVSPFQFFSKQPAWSVQVHIAFLLQLAWEDAQSLKLLDEEREGLKNFQKAIKSGALAGLQGTRGDLEEQQIRLEEELSRCTEQLSTFKVHPQYRELELEANRLTEEIHSLSNHNYQSRRVHALYSKDLASETSAASIDVEVLYKEAGVELGDGVRKRLDEVKNFHEQVVSNRRSFLALEAKRLDAEIADREQEIEKLTALRAKRLILLQTHNALEEYNDMHQACAELSAELEAVRRKLEDLRTLERDLSSLTVRRAELAERARRDYDERSQQRARAIRLFNSNSQYLYSAHGRLVIDFVENGFKFAVDIQRSGSDGIENMKIFCFDLMLAQLWSTARSNPGFLFHDSAVFEADARQRALAIELSAQEARERGFQYICTLNSDSIPEAEFSSGFELERYVRLKLTDGSPEGSLLGIRFRGCPEFV